jgi:hypothetical protein
MTRTTSVDERLLDFCQTDKQRAMVNAVNEHGGIVKAAEALGHSDYSYLSRTISKIKQRAAMQGFSPQHDMVHVVPDGFKVKGVSTYYNQEGKASGQWVKSSADEERQAELMRAAFVAMSEDLPRAAVTDHPGVLDGDLCTVYTLTDSHVGAYCWAPEGGADWDLKIAEATLTGCFEKMIQASPNSRVAVVAQLGDWLHQDGIKAETPTSHFALDADGRFEKVIKIAIRILRRVIAMALEKHEKVVVLLAEGNHDISSSIWLRTMFAALYENEPRIEVIESPLPYYTFQHGETMLAWHHGHLKKNDQLPMLFAAQFPKMWGATTKRYAHTGHRHHVEEKEHSGMHVMQHTTLTARDAYAARGGWHSDRSVTAVTYHAKFGKHSTATICPEMIGTE